MKTISEIIKKKELDCLIFKPDKSFYEKVGINQKRWGQIYRGEIDPTITEAKAISLFLKFDISELYS